jgi:hypothetical protein
MVRHDASRSSQSGGAARSRPRALLAVVILVLVAPLLLGTAEAKEAGPDGAVRLSAPVLSPAAPIVGERFSVSGSLRNSGRRPVVLQRREGDRWLRIRASTTTRDGAYSFTKATRHEVAVLRVVAPATRARPAQITARRVVRTKVDRAGLVLDGAADLSSATAIMTPARPGRLATLEVLSGDTWNPVAPAAPQDAQGQVVFEVVNPGPAPRDYRLQVAPWRGAASYTSSAVTFTARTPDWLIPPAPVTLHLDTNGAPIVDKVTYVPGTATIGGTSYDLGIRGRGNSTWEWEKKPYRLKLAAAAPLLGMPADRDWALLANWADRSAIRNHLALTFARQQTSLDWTSRSTFVDVVLNGVPQGLYQLVEHVKLAPQRVDLPPEGLLLEVDHKAEASGDPYFTTAHDLPIAYKDPSNPSEAQKTAVQADVAQLETALYGDGPANEWHSLIDMGSFVDWYLLHEFLKNHDSNFNSSVFITWDPTATDGVFKMGPAWDFDLSVGTGYGWNMPPTGWHTASNKSWFVEMRKDPVFEAALKERWAQLKPAFAALGTSVPAIVSALGDSPDVDWTIWHENAPEYDITHGDTYDEETAHVQAFLADRWAWMDVALSD